MKYIYLAFTIVFFTACTDVIEIPLEEGPKRLVIDANINWIKGTSGNEQAIKLTETAGYFDTTIPLVHGATVVIKNSQNTAFDLYEDPMTGIYKTSTFVPVINEEYTLTVTYNGEVFTATETLMPVADIEYVEQSVDNVFGGELVKVEFFFQDPVDEENYYVSQFNYSNDILFDTYRTQSDKFTNGQLGSVLELDDTFTAGNQLTLYFYGSSKSHFNYMSLLLDQLSSGGPFGTPPAAVKGNCINTTNPDNKPLGYFRLSEMVIEPYIIKEFE